MDTGHSPGAPAPPPERRSLTGLKPHTCCARVPVLATILMAWTSKAGCKPALRFGGSKMRPTGSNAEEKAGGILTDGPMEREHPKFNFQTSTFAKATADRPRKFQNSTLKPASHGGRLIAGEASGRVRRTGKRHQVRKRAVQDNLIVDMVINL